AAARPRSSARSPAAASFAPLQAVECPPRVLGEHGIVAVRMALDLGANAAVTDVSRGDERIALQPARVVPRHVEALEGADVALEPLDEVDVGAPVGVEARAAPFDAAVPRADVLADVAAVDLRAERLPVRRRDRLRRLRPVGQAPRGVEG